MKFNRSTFIDETGGNLDAAFNCIDELIDILNIYISDDELSGIHGSGCYGKRAETTVVKILKNKAVAEYIELSDLTEVFNARRAE